MIKTREPTAVMNCVCGLQSLPGWLHGAERQQLQKMLVPADWLTQDPQFQPRQRLPLGWCPPECTRESMHPGSLDEPTRAATEADGTPLCDVRQCRLPSCRILHYVPQLTSFSAADLADKLSVHLHPHGRGTRQNPLAFSHTHVTVYYIPLLTYLKMELLFLRNVR